MEKALQLLKTYFGYDSFKKGQAELIGSILNGQDALGIMPTGARKIHLLSNSRFVFWWYNHRYFSLNLPYERSSRFLK